jgi:MSHA biogenesis protein MshJ
MVLSLPLWRLYYINGHYVINFIKNSISAFNKLSLREALLFAAAISLFVLFIAYSFLLVPQQKKIKSSQMLTQSQQAELASINAMIALKEKEVALNLELSKENLVARDALKKQVDKINIFFGQSDPSTSQVGALIKELLSANPGLTLMSLKTLPAVVFYTPAQQVPVNGSEPQNIALKAQGSIYKNGVEVSVKGKYMALLSYMENVQNYPKRLFWSEAKLDVSAYPEAVLSLVIYSLSEQSSSPLR